MLFIEYLVHYLQFSPSTVVTWPLLYHAYSHLVKARGSKKCQCIAHLIIGSRIHVGGRGLQVCPPHFKLKVLLPPMLLQAATNPSSQG